MTTPDPFAPGYRLTDGNALNFRIANPQWSTTSSVSATSGGTMTTSTKIVDAVTNITTASAPGAGMTLPQAIMGTVLLLSNNSANDVRIFADGDSTINGLDGHIGIILAKGTTGIFTAVATKQWSQLNTTNSAGITTIDNITTLRSLTVNLYTVAFVEGYYVKGDGGGGYFYGVSGGSYTDNGGTIITPNGGTDTKAWLRIFASEINVRWFGAKPTVGFDNTPSFAQARTAADANSVALYVPGGTYYFDSPLSSAENLIMRGDGDATVLDFSAASPSAPVYYAIEVLGSYSILAEPTVMNEGERSVTFATAPALVPGDIFFIYDTTDGSYNSARPYYRAGEWCEVQSVVGNVAYVRVPLYQTYTAGPTISAYKSTGPAAQLKDFTINTINSLLDGNIYFSLCRDAVIDNVTSIIDRTPGGFGGGSCAALDRCYAPVVKEPVFRNLFQTNADSYGLSIGGSQHVRVFGGIYEAGRHGITHGGGDVIGSVPVRDSRIIGACVRGLPTVATNAADIHGDSEDCAFINCSIFGGAQFGGKNNSYLNCEITNREDGVIVLVTEAKGGNFTVSGCTLKSYANPSSSARAYIACAQADGSLGSFTDETFTFNLTNNTLFARNEGASPVFLRLEPVDTAVNTNVNIDGLVGDIATMYTILFTQQGAGATANSQFIIIDNIANFPAGTYLHDTATAAYHTFPHRCQRQTGQQALTATTGDYLVEGSLENFKYIYPKIPSAVATASPQSGSVLYLGTAPILGMIETLYQNAIQPALITGDSANTWAADAAMYVNWQASIDEV